MPSPLPIIGCSRTKSSLKPRVAGWLICLSICQAWPMGIQAIQERVGYIPAGSSGWGRGASSCYTFCESEHMEGKGKQSRPTHPLQLVNTPLLLPLFSHYVATHTHAMTHCLIYLIRYKQGLCIKRFLSILFIFFLVPLPLRGEKPPCHLLRV